MLPSSLLCAGDLVGVRKGSETLEGCPLLPLPSCPLNASNVGSSKATFRTYRGLSLDLVKLIEGGEIEVMLLNGTVCKANRRKFDFKAGQLSRQFKVAKGLFWKLTLLLVALSALTFTATRLAWTTPEIPRLKVAELFVLIVFSTCEVVSFELSRRLNEIIGVARVVREIGRWAQQKMEDPDASLGVDPSGTGGSPPSASAPSQPLPLTNYLAAVARSWLSSDSRQPVDPPPSLPIPIPSQFSNIVEKLANVSCVAFVDDDLICSSRSCEPQQILIPTTSGLKLLDIEKKYDDDDEDDSDSDNDNDRAGEIDYESRSKSHGLSMDGGALGTYGYVLSDSSDSDDEYVGRKKSKSTNKISHRNKKHRRKGRADRVLNNQLVDTMFDEMEFEDPRWWEHLPSLKGIGKKDVKRIVCVLLHYAR